MLPSGSSHLKFSCISMSVSVPDSCCGGTWNVMMMHLNSVFLSFLSPTTMSELSIQCTFAKGKSGSVKLSRTIYFGGLMVISKAIPEAESLSLSPTGSNSRKLSLSNWWSISNQVFPPIWSRSVNYNVECGSRINKIIGMEEVIWSVQWQESNESYSNDMTRLYKPRVSLVLFSNQRASLLSTGAMTCWEVWRENADVPSQFPPLMRLLKSSGMLEFGSIAGLSKVDILIQTLPRNCMNWKGTLHQTRLCMLLGTTKLAIFHFILRTIQLQDFG